MKHMEAWPSVRQEHLDALCRELRAVVDDATACGNEVVETWTGYGQAVRLKKAEPVLVRIPDDVRAKLIYKSLRDAHYWLGEISCRVHRGWFIALSFDSPDAQEPVGLPSI
jgi:hypothetical protein